MPDESIDDEAEYIGRILRHYGLPEQYDDTVIPLIMELRLRGRNGQEELWSTDPT